MSMRKLDLSVFKWRDAADIGLQRTSGLLKLPVVNSLSYRMWAGGNSTILNLEARLRKRAIIRNACNELSDEFTVISKSIGDLIIDNMMDIGCGHGLIDILFYEKYGCNLHLVDIETTEAKHHEYRESGAGYGSLVKARQFLETNGVPRSKIKITNPMKEQIEANNLDLIISLLSCGFHYPVAEYAEFVKTSLKSGGLFIFDMRENSEQEDFFELFPNWFVIEEHSKSRRIGAIC